MIIDIIIAVIVISSIITGIIRGFIKELSTLLGLILGIYIAAHNYPVLQKYVLSVFPNTTVSKIISFLIILFIVFFLMMLLGLLLQKVIKLIMLGWLDKILGGVFGIIKGLLFVWLLLVLIITFFPTTQNTINKSQLAMKILSIGSEYTKFPERIKKNKKPLTKSINYSILAVSQVHRFVNLTEK
jgi:membrane protein required for colicin V production